MEVNVLREKFRTFFQKKNHVEVKSASLIPDSDDPTVLFTTAGMQPFVPNLMGAPHPKGNRIFNTQKCFRTPDIDEVGDDTHHTFFEMLGNWSFGDYFKKEAIDFAYDFFVKELGLDPSRFAVTIFQGDSDAPRDDEAEAFWLAKPGISQKQIFTFGKADNFWGPAGKTGPCGPCSEIHYDRGEQYGADVGPNSDENQRYVEIWNLVFMEFDKKEDGSYQKLQQKNVDTGVGFERLLAVLQKKDSAFDTELFREILKKISEVSGKQYQNEKRSFRIIADHIRGATFLISDGVTPGNEGKKYVLRRLIRRSIREGRKLGLSKNFTKDVSKTVILEYSKLYPELSENVHTILSILDIEEENFRKTLERGEKMLEEMVEKKEGQTISGDEAFRLFDTYGFPLDLTKDFAMEHGFSLDEEGFQRAMEKQKSQSRQKSGDAFERNQNAQERSQLPATVFVGYSQMQSESEIVGLFSEKQQKSSLVLDKTPFYAESGGQVGDSGVIEGESGKMVVEDCQKTATGVFVHYGTVSGTFHRGEKVTAEIDVKKRAKVTCHHSFAHLFLGAAQKVLGSDVHQAGSHTDEHRMRFDFTFPRAVKPEEMKSIERHIMDIVLASAPVTTEEMSLQEAKTAGVEATFGEKYGDWVRTVRMGDFSFELCGGTHVENTSQIGALKIISESGISAGVRRVEGVCSETAQRLFDKRCKEMQDISKVLKVPESEVLHRLESLFADRKEMNNKMGILEKKLAEYIADEQVRSFESLSGKNVSIITDFSGDQEMSGKCVRSIIQKGGDIALLFLPSGAFFVATSQQVSAKEVLHKVVKHFGGGGGGSEVFASGGGVKEVTKEEILHLLKEFSSSSL
jgi:alanyl-tRNA synthetase